MKHLLIFLISLSSFSQGTSLSDDEFLSASVFVDANASVKEQGLNIGAAFQLTSTWKYVSISTQSFSALKGGYNDIVLSAGYNLMLGQRDRHQLNAGGRIGRVFRKDDNGNLRGANLLGFEAMYHYYFSRFFLGLKATINYRQDNKIFYDDDAFWRESGFLVIGVKF